MEERDDGSVGEPSNLDEYLADIPEIFEIAKIETIPLFSKDSSEVTPDDWAEIAETIYARKKRNITGFVVTGGTDTLPNVSAAIAFALGPGLDYPVICVGAQVHRQVWHGDARINLIRACTLATLGNQLPEVAILSNDAGYRAVRTEKKDDYRFDAFHSPTIEPLATLAYKITLGVHVRKPNVHVELICKAEFETNIFKLQFYPGLKAEYVLSVLRNNPIKGLIIETPGIGVLPLKGDFSLVSVLDYCTDHFIPVLLLSQHPTKESLGTNYEPAKGAKRAVVMTAPNMSPTAATVKFMWLLPQVRRDYDDSELNSNLWIEDLFNKMNREFVGELDQSEGKVKSAAESMI
jgi:L-asparaginase/Glu-tRNA(Gln) amidotransferase subunit D